MPTTIALLKGNPYKSLDILLSETIHYLEMHLSLRVFGVGRTSGAWGVENNILGVDSDGFGDHKRHLNRVLQVCCIYFGQRHNIQGYPDEIREAAHFTVE